MLVLTSKDAVSLLFGRISPNNLWAIGTVVSTDASQLFEATIIVQAAGFF